MTKEWSHLQPTAKAFENFLQAPEYKTKLKVELVDECELWLLGGAE